MRIYGANGTALATTSKTTRRTASGTFTLNEEEAPSGAAAATTLRSVGTIDALIALQGLEDATERRKRAVTQGRAALDELEQLKIDMLDGSLDPSNVSRLKAVAAGLKQGSGDPGLDTVLAEIDLRVEVELAKASRR
ncbi:MAG TPA: flagellar assembly protein FliX [Pseudolabrys sp.]|nr:flagellar assembly protein FliX [Pseudolabrys sp.]